MITNVEALVSKKRKERFQHNLPVEFQTANLDYYLEARQPDPGLGDAEPYNESGILPSRPDCNPRQIILHETASSTDAVATEYRQLKTERGELMKEYHNDIRRYWNTLMGMPKIAKIFYKPVIVQVWQPLKRLRMRDGFRVIKQRVTLKPRLVPWRMTKLVRSYEHGRPITRRLRYVTLRRVTPYVWRDVRVPRFKYVVLRTAGMYPRRVRVKTVVLVHDWATIRRKYAAYKQARIATLRPRLESITKRFEILKGKLKHRAPMHMASWTTHGFIEPYQPGESRSQSVYQVRGVERRETSAYFRQTNWDYIPSSPWKHKRHGAFIFYSPGYGPVADLSTEPPNVTEAQEAWFGREHHLSQTGLVQTLPRLARGQGDYRFIERPTLEKQAMLAYSTVKSLTKAKDYQFQWFRSLVELKDTKQSVKTLRAISKAGAGFLTWVAGIPSTPVNQQKDLTQRLSSLSKRFGSTVRLLAAGYLTYKFAIEPTMADVDTVIKSTTDWLLEIRRALSSILTDPNSCLNTFHARAKYGDSVRELKLGRDVDLRADDRTIEISVPCTIRWPSFLWRQWGEYPAFRDADAFTSVLSGPNQIEEDGWYNFPSVTLPIRLTADSGVFERPLTVDGLSTHAWWVHNPIHPAHIWTSVDELYGDVSPSLSIQEIEDWILHKTFNDSPVVERYPAYLSTWTKGVVFGEFRLDDLLSLLAQPGSSSPELSGLLNNVYTGACDILTRLDSVKTAWELTPLSFVYDWFTDSSLLVTTLANMARSEWTIYNQVPSPLHGVWESRRTELLAGTGMYQFAGCECLEYIGSSRIDTDAIDWQWAGFSPILRPVVSHRRYRLRFEAINDKVRLMRTGLYRVRRGEQTGYAGLASYLPNVSVSITGGKILSLSALITSLFGGKGR